MENVKWKVAEEQEWPNLRSTKFFKMLLSRNIAQQCETESC